MTALYVIAIIATLLTISAVISTLLGQAIREHDRSDEDLLIAELNAAYEREHHGDETT